MVRKIPSMDDNELARLLHNALDLIHRHTNVINARAVISAIEAEWARRLASFHAGQYKAETPPEGVLKAIGYRVGNNGLPEARRHQLLDFAITGILPPVGSPAYMAEWGAPKTRVRYAKLHRVIRVLASSAHTLGNMEIAGEDWEADLKYIERKWRSTCL